MAGDWIKFELSTLDKPEVLQMADLLTLTKFDVVARLLKVWGWFDQNSVDGNAGGVTGVTLMKFIDDHVGRQGFAACMKKVGWLTDTGIPNFEDHNGESAKKRALTLKRQKRFRNAHVTPTALPEKRREEKNPVVPLRFEEFWNLYPGPRKVGKAKCMQVWIDRGFTAVADQILLHVQAMSGSAQWREAGGKFIPAPLTYLNQRRFEDGLPETPSVRLAI